MSSLALPHGVIEKLASIHDPEEAKAHILKSTAEALKGVTVLYNQVLVAIYIRPERTAGGIIRPGQNVTEDVWQGKSGLVLKCGPNAFEDDEGFSFHGQKAEIGDWIVFKVGDAWSVQIGGFACRLVQDSNIRMKVTDPNVVF
jgi:co-chaperonin GroES (HSP10)